MSLLHCLKYYFMFLCFSISVHTLFKVNKDNSRLYSIMLHLIRLMKQHPSPSIYVSRVIESGNIKHCLICIQLEGGIYIHTKLTLYYFYNLFYSELNLEIKIQSNRICLFVVPKVGMVHSDSIKLLSVNCQGLRGKQKRMEVLTYLKEAKASIVCLQDTHLIEDDLNSVKQIWGNCYLHGIKTNSRGIGILLNKDFEFDVLEIKKDKEGNMLSLLISIDTIKINLITIYGPNDDPNFFKDLQNNIDCTNAQYTIICGDFNLVLDPKKYCIHYTNVNNPRARTEVLEMIKIRI